MDAIAMPDRIDELERLILETPQVDLRTENIISGGMLARTIFIPEGCVLTGATHKADHINTVIGDITVTTDEGVKRLTGHIVFAAKAGMKRAGIAHSLTIWTTTCRTDKTDIHEAEDDLVVESERLQTRRLELPAVPTSKKIPG